MRALLPLTARAFCVLAAVPLVVLNAGCSDGDTTSSGTAGTGGPGASAGEGGGGAGGDTGGTGATGGTGGTGAGPFMTAPHHPFPVLTGDTNIIKNGKLVTITFAGNPDADKIEQSGDVLVASQWLLDVGAEYGVGA